MYLPNQESCDMGTEINSLKEELEHSRNLNENFIKDMRDERRARESE